jgi:hypothetical protein
VVKLSEYRAGTRWRSVACETEVVIVSGPTEGHDDLLQCGGWPMVPIGTGDQERKPIRPPHNTGSQLGKRYQDQGGTFEVLCTKGGAGSLSVGEELLTVKAPKPLPASD